jgi:hypothetical protein
MFVCNSCKCMWVHRTPVQARTQPWQQLEQQQPKTTLIELIRGGRMLVIAMEQMNAANGLENPGVLKNLITESRKGGSRRLDVRFFHSDVDGAISGSS